MSTSPQRNVGRIEVTQRCKIINFLRVGRCYCCPLEGDHLGPWSLNRLTHVAETTSDAFCSRKVLVHERRACGDTVLKNKCRAIRGHVLGIAPNLAADNSYLTLELARWTAAFGPTIDKHGCVR